MANDGPKEMTVPLVYWLPYLTVTNKGRSCSGTAISKATLCDDTDETWRNILGVERPEVCKMFCNFLNPQQNASSEPLFGTIIYSDDTEWL